MFCKKLLQLTVFLSITATVLGDITYTGPMTHEFVVWRGENESPAVAVDPNSGNYFVVYEDPDSDYFDNENILCDIFDPNTGTILSRITLEDQHDTRCKTPDIAMNAHGKFVVVWESKHDTEGIFGRIFSGNCNPLTDVFAINNVTAGRQYEPQVAINDNGLIVVVWTSGESSGGIDAWRVSGRLFNESGTPLGSEFDIAPTTDSYNPTVAMDNTGKFAVVWTSDPNGSAEYKVALRMYDPDGSPRTNAKYIDEDTNTMSTPDIDMYSDGSFVVVWDADPSSAINCDVYAQRFDPNGIEKANSFVVNQYSSGRQEMPSVSISKEGNFVVVWQSENADGNDYGICGRRYDPNDIPPYGDEFSINTYVYSKQHRSDVAFKKDDQFLTVWQGDGRWCALDSIYCDGSPYVYGQFGPKPAISSSCDAIDVTRNGYVDLDDLFYIANRWLEWGYNGGYDDGRMDMIDFSFLGTFWNYCCKEESPFYLEIFKNNCISRLSWLGVTITIYALDFGGEFPPTLEELIWEVNGSGPWDKDRYLTCQADCPNIDGVSYIYRGDDLDESCPSYMVLIYDKYENHDGQFRNVLFGDGHVESMSEQEFQAAIDIDNNYRSTRPELEVKPVPWGGD